MRSDDDTTAQRVSRLLDQARRPDPPVEAEVWPAEWPPGDPGGRPEPPDERFLPGAGFRRQIPVRAAMAAAVAALMVVGVAAVVLLRGPAPGTVVPARAPAPLGETPFAAEPTGASLPAGTAAAPAGQTGPTGTGAAAPVASGVGASAAGQVRVYVVGQVHRPGVVALPPDARVEDAVQAVGGATGKADLAVMNLARKLVDGERIVVPRPGEKIPTADPGPGPAAAGPGAVTGGSGSAGGAGAAPGAPVDLNTATVAQLDALPGVGPVLAGRIVAWREENGRFTQVEDLTEVQGIGDATMDKLRPLVRV